MADPAAPAAPAAPAVQVVAPNLRRARPNVDVTKPLRRDNEPLNVARPFAHPAPTPPKENES